MNKYILIFLCLFKLSLFTGTFLYYSPMSKKSIDFGEEVCYYEDISDDSKLNYVKGCPSGKRCLPVLADNSEYNIHTCQPFFSDLKRQIGEDCDANLYECTNDYDCTNGKCSIGTGGAGTSPTCSTIGKKINSGQKLVLLINLKFQLLEMCVKLKILTHQQIRSIILIIPQQVCVINYK